MTEIIEVGKVFSTTDYNYFKKLIGNRNVEKYAKLKENIERDGQLVPVVVNEKQEVLDGQHRIVILKELQRPVEFVVKKGGNFSSVISMNTAQKNWATKEYIEAFAKQGNEDYSQMLKVSDEFPNLNLTVVICGLAGIRTGTFGRLRKNFIEGRWRVTNSVQFYAFANFYKKTINETLLEDCSRLQSSLWSLFTIKGFDQNRFIDRINASGRAHEINLYKRAAEVLKELVLLYNARMSSSNPKYINFNYNSRGAIILDD